MIKKKNQTVHIYINGIWQEQAKTPQYQQQRHQEIPHGSTIFLYLQTTATKFNFAWIILIH